MRLINALWVLVFLCTGAPVWSSGDLALSGASLSLLWVLPFAGILLCLSLMPLLAPQLWHSHYGKIGGFWASLTLGGMLVAGGWQTVLYEVCHTYSLHFFPFIILVSALYTISGGIKITVHAHATPACNTLILFVASIAASLMGTTGAAMLFIRPLLEINKSRSYQTHTVVFFILLVCNIGGALTALGDPPLFLGFLSGIDFFWPTLGLFVPTMALLLPLLAVYWVLDLYMLRRSVHVFPSLLPGRRVNFAGKRNFIFLGIAIGAVLMSGLWKSSLFATLFHVQIYLQDLLRDVILLILIWASWRFGPKKARKDNDFSWEPLFEVTKLFAAIFITAAPVLAILKVGQEGSMSGLVAMVSQNGAPVNAAYFWLSGILSAFLDNAPTYLVFFSLAGGDAQTLMGPLEKTLVAFSMGSVFMGALTYIGNAPNFMVRSIAESAGVPMPHFFGYMAWSCGLLLPLFLLLTYILF